MCLDFFRGHRSYFYFLAFRWAFFESLLLDPWYVLLKSGACRLIYRSWASYNLDAFQSNKLYIINRKYYFWCIFKLPSMVRNRYLWSFCSNYFCANDKVCILQKEQNCADWEIKCRWRPTIKSVHWESSGIGHTTRNFYETGTGKHIIFVPVKHHTRTSIDCWVESSKIASWER
jgi:hypothetical protein